MKSGLSRWPTGTLRRGSRVVWPIVWRDDGCRNPANVSLSRRRCRTSDICLVLVVFFSIISSTDCGIFKRLAGGTIAGKASGIKKVKESVAWLMEDDGVKGGWKHVSDDGRVRVWKREVPGSPFVAIKSSAILKATQQALFEVLTPGDIDIVKQYNPLLDKGRDIVVWDRDNKVSWSTTMAIWPCRPRDFVTHIQRARLDDGSVAIVNSATTHPEAPETSRYVRGEILNGMFHIRRAANTAHAEFTMVHHFNPGGSLPAWLVNWLAEGKPSSFVRRLEVVAQKWDAEAARVKHMPCKGRGFADRPCAFLVSRGDGSDTEAPSQAGMGLGWGGDWGREDMERQGLLRTALTVLAAVILTLGSVSLGWSVLNRHKREAGDAVQCHVADSTASMNGDKLPATNGSSSATMGTTSSPSSPANGDRSCIVANGH